MPVQHSPFEQIVNVQWEEVGGAIFVVKSDDSHLAFGQVESNTADGLDDNWTDLGAPFDAIGGFFANSGGSSAIVEVSTDGGHESKQVYVMSGFRENANGDEGSFIIYSENGTTWKKVYERYADNDSDHRDPWIFEPTGIVWDDDEKAFYAAFYHAVLDLPTEANGFQTTVSDGESICRSTDGQTWTLISDSVSSGVLLTDDDPSKLDPHCKRPENKGKIPDGLQAYDEATRTFMKPKGLSNFGPVNGANYSEDSSAITIEGFDDDGNLVTRERFMSAPCYAIAQRNGTWIATGGNDDGPLQIDGSVDLGQTWKRAFTVEDAGPGAVCIAGESEETTA